MQSIQAKLPLADDDLEDCFASSSLSSLDDSSPSDSASDSA